MFAYGAGAQIVTAKQLATFLRVGCKTRAQVR